MNFYAKRITANAIFTRSGTKNAKANKAPWAMATLNIGERLGELGG